MRFLSLLFVSTVVFLVIWAIASLIVWFGLNDIGGFAFNFRQIVGIGYLAGFLANLNRGSTVVNNISR